jgi:hypothetical protein
MIQKLTALAELSPNNMVLHLRTQSASSMTTHLEYTAKSLSTFQAEAYVTADNQWCKN